MRYNTLKLFDLWGNLRAFSVYSNCIFTIFPDRLCLYRGFYEPFLAVDAACGVCCQLFAAGSGSIFVPAVSVQSGGSECTAGGR